MWRGIGAVLWGLLEGDFWIAACFGGGVGELVVHWLDNFPGFPPVFGGLLGASGPLFKVVHWLGDFPRFGPVSGSFLGASGPLFRVDH